MNWVESELSPDAWDSWRAYKRLIWRECPEFPHNTEIAMTSSPLLLLALAAPQTAPAAATMPTENWVGLYIQGNKIGHTLTREWTEANGTRTESKTVISAAMLGAGLQMTIDSESTSTKEGKPKTLKFTMNSGGRTLKVTAEFLPGKINAVSESEGQIQKQVLTIPAGMEVVEDPANEAIKRAKEGKPTGKFLVFDPNSLSLPEVTVTDMGQATRTVKGKPAKGRRLMVNDPRAPLDILLSDSGSLIHAQGPMGMEMIPESMEEALTIPTGGSDIALASSIRPDKPLPLGAAKITLKFSGRDLGHLPSDSRQQIKAQGADWLVTLNKEPQSRPSGRIGDVKGNEEWLKPDLRIPSDQPIFAQTAKKVIGNETQVLAAAEKLRQWVYSEVGVNAGIGVMRDAAEILKTKEGVCRDHAVLMAALLRSAGIPSKLVSGMVYQDGAFYYHAWVEVWSGKEWVGIDSTRPSPRLTLGHVKIAEGSVAQAFVSFLLDGAKISLVGER